ncbi:MAG: hypothetical protein Q8R47_05235 [Nanoarchaeota archaeon]|nr:hypothetical protein [Nanoarchaeota archaeon]
MVKQEKYKGKFIFVCESCNFRYATREWAEKCEHHCETKHSCSLEITKHAIKIK